MVSRGVVARPGSEKVYRLLRRRRAERNGTSGELLTLR